MTLRLDEETTEKLREVAREANMSMQAVAIEAIQAHLASRERRLAIDRALVGLHENYGEALRRLGE